MADLSMLQNIQPVTVPNPVQRVRSMAEARQMRQSSRLNEQKIAEGEHEAQAAAVAQQKAIQLHDILTRYGGDVEKALPEINQLDPVLGNALLKGRTDIAQSQQAIKKSEADIRQTEDVNAEARRKNAADELLRFMQSGREGRKPIEVSPNATLVPPDQPLPYTAPAPPEKPQPQIPGRDIPFPADVEAQRNRMNASRAQTQGLSPQQFTRAQTLASQFDSNQVVKQYNEASLRAANVQNILNSKWSGPGDMAMVFEFMRALDPTSVVRESEYATAAKTGNWFTGAFARFNGKFNPKGGFLSDQVKKDFNAVLQGKMQSATKQVKGMYQDFGRRIDKITGKNDGTEYLTDPTAMLDGQASPDTVKPGFRIVP